MGLPEWQSNFLGHGSGGSEKPEVAIVVGLDDAGRVGGMDSDAPPEAHREPEGFR
jgi:hypothetical protein